jgi:hypothetical protein
LPLLQALQGFSLSFFAASNPFQRVLVLLSPFSATFPKPSKASSLFLLSNASFDSVIGYQ